MGTGFSLVLLEFLVMPLRPKVEAGDQQPVEMKSLKKSLKWNFLSVCGDTQSVPRRPQIECKSGRNSGIEQN